MKKSLLLLMLCTLSLSAVESAKVYKQCTMCHGKHGEKVAMKSSPKLSTLEVNDLASRMKVIKDGSSTMSKKYLGMHQAKFKKVDMKEIDALAEYIVSLK